MRTYWCCGVKREEGRRGIYHALMSLCPMRPGADWGRARVRWRVRVGLQAEEEARLQGGDAAH
jgi:hypothetical protein